MTHQMGVWEDDHRYKIVCCGRRWGKTVLGLDMCVMGHGPLDPNTGIRKYPGALHGKSIYWLSPTFGIASLIWGQLKSALRDAWIRKLEAEKTIFLPGGGSIAVKSAENWDAIRGAGLDGCVMDEAAFYAPEVWAEVMRPSLADKQGWAVFISTPKGKNWFWEMFERAPILDDWERWQQPTSMNPIIPPEEIEAAKEEVTALGFRQEFLAEFVTPGGNIFRREWFSYYERTDDANIIQLNLPDDQGTKPVRLDECLKFMTCDLAASLKESADYTVFTVWGLHGSDLILLDILRQRLEGPDQLPALRQMADEWKPAYIGIERVQYQLTFLQLARRSGLPVRELKSDKDKFSRAQTAAVKYQNRQIYTPMGHHMQKTIEDELLSFSGDPKENAHDDIVDCFSYAAAEASYREGGYGSVFGLKRCVGCDTLFFPGIDKNNPRNCPKCGRRPVIIVTS